VSPLFSFDADFIGKTIVGTDEAGRGPLAGPVFAAAVCLDYNQSELLSEVNDSKKLSPQKRENLFDLITNKASRCFSITQQTPQEIDRLNIHQASLLAMKQALEELSASWDLALIDGRFLIPDMEVDKQQAIIKGDAKSACIAAASILAKVARDRHMLICHEEYPQYDFAKHKGYGTARHIELLKKFGPSPIHRKTFCNNFLT
jgi:ribonuclease HII